MNTNYSNVIELKGSHKMAPLAEKIKGIDKSESISISVHLSPKEPLPALTDREQYKKFKTLLPGKYSSKGAIDGQEDFAVGYRWADGDGVV